MVAGIFPTKPGNAIPGREKNAIPGNDNHAKTNDEEKLEARLRARAKAEEEAEAKNEANRQAYADEVERLKTLHEAKLNKFKGDLESFAKAEKAYKQAEAEYDATSELRLARMFNDDKVFTIARRRFREIISRYPGTQAAKDAEALLNNQFVAVRATPSKPTPPIAPVEPKLVLPRSPEPVAVVYPAEPDDTEPVQLASEKDIPNGDFKETKSGTYQTPIRLTNGKTVFVRGYYRRDGTYVAPHTRSEPGTATKSGGTRHRR